MRILAYRGLDTEAIPGYQKLAAYLAAEDFRSADVKKVADNLYRARLDRSNRLLFALCRHQGERCALVLRLRPTSPGAAAIATLESAHIGKRIWPRRTTHPTQIMNADLLALR